MSATLKIQMSLLLQINKDSDNFAKRSVKERTKNYISNRIAILEENFKTSTQQHHKGIADAEPETGKELEDCYEKIRERYLDYKTALLDSLDKVQATVHEPVSASLNTSDKSHLTLPKVYVPTFTGDYQSWKSFYDLFDALINKNATLTDVEKLHYLKSSVGGEAERLIQHLTIANSNYKPAWDILTSRYDHKRFIVNAQLQTFFGLKSLTAETSVGLKGLLDTSVECRHALKNLGIPVYEWDTIIIFILTKKLPILTQQLWEEKLGSTKELPKFDAFKEFRESRFRTLEAVGFHQAADSSKLGRVPPVKAKALHIKTTPKTQPNCNICQKGAHPIRTCNRFRKMDINSRRNAIQILDVCENCLAYNHSTQQCTSSVRCYICQQPHHNLLHFPPPSSSQQRINQYNLRAPNTTSDNTTSAQYTQHPCKFK